MKTNSGLRVTILRDDPGSVVDSRHRYGRSPTFTPPLCSACHRPLDLVFDFDFSDPQLEFLGVGDTGRLYVLTCLGCDLAYAGQLYYRTTGTHIEVLRNDATTSFDAVWEKALPPCSVSLAPVPTNELPESFPSEQDWRDAVEFSETPQHQLGGTPLWVQDELEVDCCSCGRRMKLLGQVASETWPVADTDLLAGHMFGDMGMIYLHYCERCRVWATGGSCY